MLDEIEADLKTALLAGDKSKVETLRGLKSAILNEVIAKNARETGLSDEQIQQVLGRESKKRQEAADLYKQAGEQARADAELSEKSVIDAYLPAQLPEEEVAKAVEAAISELNASSVADMGKVIGAVRTKLGASADGAVIARLAKAKLQ